jgi:hypothetical protein
MKKVSVRSKSSGLSSLTGKTITLFCANYIYTGKLKGVSKECVRLSEPKIVYETGGFDSPTWKDAQALPNDLYVQLGMVESFTVLKQS